jgi:hypothetical protein
MAMEDQDLCLYLDDICEEVVSTVTMRNKETVALGASVALQFLDVNLDDVLSYVKDTLSNERHISKNSARRDFWAGLLSSGAQMMAELLHTLAGLFASLYKSCDLGKDKYMKFQLQWHQCCSVFLLPPEKELTRGLCPSSKKCESCPYTVPVGWLYCEGRPADKNIRDAVMISVCSTVCNYNFSEAGVEGSAIDIGTHNFN